MPSPKQHNKFYTADNAQPFLTHRLLHFSRTSCSENLSIYYLEDT